MKTQDQTPMTSSVLKAKARKAVAYRNKGYDWPMAWIKVNIDIEKLDDEQRNKFLDHCNEYVIKNGNICL